jgi:DDE_Tnp_1-associated
MNHPSPLSLREHFESVDDPRVERTKEYALRDIMVIAICAVICGADDWVDIAGWGNEKIEFLRQFMP